MRPLLALLCPVLLCLPLLQACGGDTDNEPDGSGASGSSGSSGTSGQGGSGQANAGASGATAGSSTGGSGCGRRLGAVAETDFEEQMAELADENSRLGAKLAAVEHALSMAQVCGVG